MNSYITCPIHNKKVERNQEGKFVCPDCQKSSLAFLEVKGTASYITCPIHNKRVERNKEGKFVCSDCSQEQKTQTLYWCGK